MNTWEFIKEAYKRATNRAVLTEAPSGGVRDPKKVRIKQLGQALKGSRGGEFEEPEVDLEEISRAYHTDSYIKRAVNKYSSLMFKAGWDISGRNEAASEYVWTRLKLMSEATGKPIDQFFSQIAHDMILFGNAYVVKARQKGKTAATGVNAQGYTGKQPVAGYFVLPPTTISVSRDENGKILKYQQASDGGSGYDIKPEDMIHFAADRPSGRAYGIPFIFNVMDDVKMLRQIEENVARLVYRNLFPLYLYQVGLDKPGFEASDEEIEEIREQIRDMPMDGGIVVPERHNISAIGAGGTALDAEPYLKYFRQRVFTGLGVSDSVMGIGDTANKSTSDNQSADLHDGVKEFQRVYSDVIQFNIINEILFEGGFDPIMNPDDEVRFEFFEIELDAKIKKENHAIQLFLNNAITHDELRSELGRDPVSDEGRLYSNMFASLNAGAENASESKDKPSNQHGKKDSPGKPKRESIDELGTKKQGISENFQENSSNVLTAPSVMVTLSSELQINSYLESMKKFWDNLRDDVVEMVKREKPYNEIRGFAVELVRQSLRSGNRQYIGKAMVKGLDSVSEELGAPITNSLNTQFATEQIIQKSESYINRLMNDISSLLESALTTETSKERVAKVIGAFNSNEYRLSFIAKTELYRAYNYGKAVAAKEAGHEAVGIESHEGCDKCLEKQSQSIVLTDDSLIDAVPPHHPNCTCLVKLSMPAEEV